MLAPLHPVIVRLESFEGPDAAGALERPKARASMRRRRLAQCGGETAEPSPQGRGALGAGPLVRMGETMFPPWTPFLRRIWTLGRYEAALEQSSAPPAARCLFRCRVKAKHRGADESSRLLCGWGLTAIGPPHEPGGRDRAALFSFVDHSAFHATGDRDDLARDVARDLVGGEDDDLARYVVGLRNLA
jgi:hypothetical protein